jgi:hypothetical protein
MSYAIFADSLPLGRLQYYMRKTISGVGEGGEPLQELVKRPPGSLRVRARLGENTRYDVVPLPADTAIVPRGEYLCERTMFKQGVGTTQETGDSTVYTENRENRTVFTNLDVPITHIAKEDIERLYHRRAWQRGRSGEGAPIALVEQALGAARLIEYGEGEKPRLTPLAYQKPVRTAASAAVRKPAGTPKTR